MERAAALVDSRKRDVVEWLIHESGSTRLKAEWEWMLMQLSMREAASMPFHSDGRVLPSAVAGKENHVHRQPVGVVGVISPWNFPITCRTARSRRRWRSATRS
jgi:aldehyde dehydrogenase (NAD+)